MTFSFDVFASLIFSQTATTEIYTLSLHDALPIYRGSAPAAFVGAGEGPVLAPQGNSPQLAFGGRSEEHTSELQSRFDLVCRLLLEKNKCICARVYLAVFRIRPSDRVMRFESQRLI